MITIELTNLQEALAYADRMGLRHVPDANERALSRIGMIAHREAVRNAPKSPTQQELNSARGGGKKRKRKRNPRAFSRPSPGGLMRSISWASNAENAEVYVAASSEAGKYAFRIHSEKGITWHKRGPGTVAKGARADAWFILRALEDNAPDFYRIFDHEHEKGATP